jgi:hypothetical protein
MSSAPSTSSIAERVNRVSPATANQPSVTAGRTRWAGVPIPDVGNTRNITPKIRISTSPSPCPAARLAPVQPVLTRD